MPGLLLAVPLLHHLESLHAGDNPTTPLFPKACAARRRSQYGGMISSQFYGILVAKPRPHINRQEPGHLKSCNSRAQNAHRANGSIEIILAANLTVVFEDICLPLVGRR